METRGRTPDGDGDRSRDGNESSGGDEDGDGDGCRIMLETAQGREAKDSIGEGGGQAKKCKKHHKSCRRDVRNGGNLGGKRKNVETKVLVQ